MANLHAYPLDEIFVEKLEDWMVPMWVNNWVSCFRTAVILPTGTVDCTFVQTCMQSIIDWINATTSLHTSQIINYETRVANLEALPQHAHSNLSVLDWLIDSGAWSSYLWADWLYHPMSDRYWYYNRIETEWGWNFAPEQVLAFSSDFTVVEDTANWRTIIQFNWAASGWTGTDTNDYTTSWSYDPVTSNLTMVRTNWSFVIDLSALQNDLEDEYVTAMNFNPLTNILTLTRNVGIDLTADLSSITFSETSVTVVAKATVTVNHNKWRHPSFVCTDIGWNLVTPWNILYSDSNNATLSFSPMFTWNIYYV